MPSELTEFYVTTTCGRNFVWSEHDYGSLIRSLHFRGYTPAFIQPYSEYEAEVKAREEQERLNHELTQAVETEGMKRSA